MQLTDEDSCGLEKKQEEEDEDLEEGAAGGEDPIMQAACLCH